MNWIAENPYEAAIAFLTATTTLAICARLIIGALGQYAKTTPSLEDDRLIASWAAKADAAVAILDVVRRCLPRVVVGPWPTTQPIASVSQGQTPAPMKPVSMPPSPLVDAAVSAQAPWPPGNGKSEDKKP